MPTVPRVAFWPQQPFSPDSAIGLPGFTNTNNACILAVTNANARVSINMNGATQVEVYNSGTADCAVNFGDNTVSAVFPVGASGDYVVGAGQRFIISFHPSIAAAITSMAAICSGTNTTTLFGFPGVGAT